MVKLKNLLEKKGWLRMPTTSSQVLLLISQLHGSMQDRACRGTKAKVGQAWVYKSPPDNFDNFPFFLFKQFFNIGGKLNSPDYPALCLFKTAGSTGNPNGRSMIWQI